MILLKTPGFTLRLYCQNFQVPVFSRWNPEEHKLLFFNLITFLKHFKNNLYKISIKLCLQALIQHQRYKKLHHINELSRTTSFSKQTQTCTVKIIFKLKLFKTQYTSKIKVFYAWIFILPGFFATLFKTPIFFYMKFSKY